MNRAPETTATLSPGKIVSIHLSSNRPQNFVRFLDCIEAYADHPESIEVVVKIDDTDVAMNALLPIEVAKRRLTLKFISTPLPDGFYGLWRALNDMLPLTDPDAYFVVNLNDEMYFGTQGWDSILRQHVGLFPDHVFRLRTSVLNRHRNYHDLWECGFAPETSAFTTQTWLRIGGDWTPCTGPETFQQCVAFYFSLYQRFSSSATCRDIAINDISVVGEGADVSGIPHRALRLRQSGAIRQWFILMSHGMQQEASRRARALQAHIFAVAHDLPSSAVRTEASSIVVIHDGITLQRFDYRLSRLRIGLRNTLRFFNFHYYSGGGDEIGRNPLWNSFLVLRLLLEGTSAYDMYWQVSQAPWPENPTLRDYTIRAAIQLLVVAPKTLWRLIKRPDRQSRN